MKMKKVGVFGLNLLMLCNSFALTEVVDGIEWNYSVASGEATIEHRIVNSRVTASIPSSTYGKIEIPSSLGGSPVAHIGSHAFYACGRITSVVVPDGVKSIDSSAFLQCSMSSIQLPDSLIVIHDHAFSYCDNLSQLVIPENVVRIEELALSDCGFKTLRIPASVQYLDEVAIHRCYKLERIEVDLKNQNYCTSDGALYDKTGKRLILCPNAKKEII